MNPGTLRAIRPVALLAGVCLSLAVVTDDLAHAAEVRRLPVAEYCDKMAGGWIGQMAGVGWGGPTEFKWKGRSSPKTRCPSGSPK